MEEVHPSPTDPHLLWGTEKQPFTFWAISIIFFFIFFCFLFFFSRQNLGLLCTAKAENIWQKWGFQSEMVQKWVRCGTTCSDAQVFQASPQGHPSSRTELPSLLGRQWEGSCLFHFCAEEDSANKRILPHFCLWFTPPCRNLSLSSKWEWNPTAFQFFRCTWLLEVLDSHSHLSPVPHELYFNNSGLWAVWKVAKNTQGCTWFIPESIMMDAKIMNRVWAHLWKRVGKEKLHLSLLIKLLAEYQSFMGVKVFSISKSEFWPELQRRLIWV